MKKIISFLIFVLFVSFNLLAQDFYSLSGFLVDKKSNKPISGVQIEYLTPRTNSPISSSISAQRGNFIIENLRAGDLVTITFKCEAYKIKVHPVPVYNNKERNNLEILYLKRKLSKEWYALGSGTVLLIGGGILELISSKNHKRHNGVIYTTREQNDFYNKSNTYRRAALLTAGTGLGILGYGLYQRLSKKEGLTCDISNGQKNICIQPIFYNQHTLVGNFPANLGLQLTF